MRTFLLCCAALVSGCLPVLEDDCVTAEQCGPGESCIAAVCVPASPVGAELDAAPGPIDNPLPETDLGPQADAMISLDAGPMADADAPADGGDDPADARPQPDAAPSVDMEPRIDVALPADAAPPADAAAPACPPGGIDCNDVDDDCDETIDEAGESNDACPRPEGTALVCDRGCDLACIDGAEPVDDDPVNGCVRPRGCAPLGDWVQLMDGLEKSDQPEQQIAFAAAPGDQRMMVVYDIEATRNEGVLRTLTFSGADPDDRGAQREARVGDARGDIEDAIYAGLTLERVGAWWVLAATRYFGVDANDVVLRLRIADNGGVRRDELHLDYPTMPAVAWNGLAGAAWTAYFASSTGEDESGLLQGWLHGVSNALDADNREVRDPEPIRARQPVGEAQIAAIRIAEGFTVFSPTWLGGQGQEPGIRIDRLAGGLAEEGTEAIALPGEIIDRIAWSRSTPGFVAFATESDEVIHVRRLNGRANALTDQAISVPWNNDPPRDLVALDLPGGPGLLYLGAERPELILVEGDPRSGSFADRLPGGENKTRALDARVIDGGRVEVVVLRESGMQGKVYVRTYDCY